MPRFESVKNILETLFDDELLNIQHTSYSLAKELKMSSSTIMSLLKFLKSQGFIDFKQHCITLTPKGKKFVKILKESLT